MDLVDQLDTPPPPEDGGPTAMSEHRSFAFA
jgi:hypothetical protein